ncbi:MAG TPA: hypothetical protein VGL19_23560 [Polyangiaceae bacterium]
MFVAPLDEYPSGDGAKPTATGGGSDTNGGEGGLTDAAGTAGMAGAPDAGAPSGGNTAGCRTNQDCVANSAGEPYLCRPADHSCVALKTEECPLAYGTASDPNAIFIGAFATLDVSVPDDNAIVWAQRLALDELSGDANGGLPGGPNGKRRPLVMVVCNNSAETVDTGLSHLADDLRVPAVLATLKPGDLRRGFDAHRDRDIFYLSPTGATRTLVDTDDHGLIWNILGQPSDLAPTYARLLSLAEAYVKAQRSLTRPVRVALVTTNEAFDSDLASFVEPVLTFNGKNINVNTDAGNYAGFTVNTSDPQPENWAQQIIAFHPDIVISTASETFSQKSGLLETLESDWNESNLTAPRPFYILSPYNAGDLSSVHTLMDSLIQGGVDATPNRRFVTVSIAGPADLTLQNQFATRLRTEFKDAYPNSGNYYDAFYFLAYAMYAAGSAPLTGSTIAAAMRRLIDGKAIDVGPANIAASFQALSKADASIELDGTLGPPNFDLASGVRHDQGSVLCFKLDSGALSLETDVLRYDTQLGQFQGTFPCFDGFYP